jgi:S-DNA-T family DNA segregation ATPase FtsK/SpoIIIE
MASLLKFVCPEPCFQYKFTFVTLPLKPCRKRRNPTSGGVRSAGGRVCARRGRDSRYAPFDVRAKFTLVDAELRIRQVVAEWAGAATLGQLLDAAATPLPHRDAPVAVDGHLFGLATPIDRCGLHDGSVLSLSATYAQAHAPTDPSAYLHLAVINGAGAGETVALTVGRSVVGRFEDSTLVVADPAVSGHHLALYVDAAGAVVIEDLGSSNGTTVDGVALTGRAALSQGQLIRLGDTLVEVRPGQAADAVVQPTGGILELRRPPRLLDAPLDATVAWPTEPGPPGRQTLPLAAALAPLAIGLVLYVTTQNVLTLLLVGMSPLMAVINLVSSRRTGKARHRKDMAAYVVALDRAEVDLAEAIGRESVMRRHAAPDAATILSTVTGPRRRLWERRRWDADFLELRLGLADLPSVVRRMEAGPFATQPLEPVDAPMVPAVLSLRDLGVLGVAGDPARIGPVASSLVAQVVCQSGPADVQLVVLAGESPTAEARWGWTRWLPHAMSEDTGGPVAIGSTRETIEARVADLTALIERRRSAAEAQRGRLESTDWPRVLVVLDPAYDLRRVAGVDILLQHGPALDIFALCLEESVGYLPVECRAVLDVGPRTAGVLRRSGEPDLAPIALDLVTERWCEAIGRALAPLRDPEALTAGGAIPTSVRLVDLLDLQRLDPVAMLEAWERAGRSTAGVVGVGVDGPVSLDLRIDGPHGLVAGTTGAGKSEFLQTLVAALAVSNRHDALNFLLVDYKGGSAFRDCARLPHTVGVVTDLDGHLTERALASLSAELKRRETLLAHGGAKDIDDYVDMGEPVGALPRLLIVIDEFAGLVAELPEFVTGLVGIAQRGRSLGIHLILATQRPSGVVSPEIRANTNLRIALRVTSPAESVDIIDAPDAARITPMTPGRAYAMTGHSALTAFQSARVGGRATAVETERGPEVAVADVAWTDEGRTIRLATSGPTGDVDPADTDLARLVEVLIDACSRSGIPAQPQPWLAPLPDVLRLGELLDGEPPTAGRLPPIPYGLVDLPAQQRQEPAVYDVERSRHLVIGGSSGSGRTMTLRALAVGLASMLHPADVWLYAVDCGGGELRRLAELPHCGAVVTRTEQDRTDRLLTRLHSEMGRRLERLAADGHTDVSEQRVAVDPAERLPYIVVLLDRWEGFLSTFDSVDGGRLTDLVLDLAREGGSAGIRLIISGDRSVLMGKLPTMIDERIALSLADRNEYSVGGFDVRKVPNPMEPGRAVRSPDTAELQVAVPGAGASGAEQAAAVTGLVAAWRERHVSLPARLAPFRVDTLPTEVDAATMAGYLGTRPETPQWALLGLGGDELAAVGVDVRAAGGFVVAGPRRSGRSTAMLVMAESMLAGGCPVLAFCPRISPLRRLRGRTGVIGVVDGDDPRPEDVVEMLNKATDALAVFVDDAMLLNNAPIADLLDNVAREGPDMGHALVIAGNPDELMRPMRGFIYSVCQSRTGLMLCPENHNQGELLGARLPRSAVFRAPAGRGIFVDNGELELLQVPLPAE